MVKVAIRKRLRCLRDLLWDMKALGRLEVI